VVQIFATKLQIPLSEIFNLPKNLNIYYIYELELIVYKSYYNSQYLKPLELSKTVYNDKY